MAQLKWDHEFHMEEDALGDDAKVYGRKAWRYGPVSGFIYKLTEVTL